LQPNSKQAKALDVATPNELFDSFKINGLGRPAIAINRRAAPVQVRASRPVRDSGVNIGLVAFRNHGMSPALWRDREKDIANLIQHRECSGAHDPPLRFAIGEFAA
jgi:hypothetical protein